jgi:hypothetical protein
LEGAKPFVEQKGPYFYWPIQVKFNVTFDDDGNTVSFNEVHFGLDFVHDSSHRVQRQFFLFDRERSAGDETDLITNVNIMFQAVVVRLYNKYDKLGRPRVAVLPHRGIGNVALDALYGRYPEKERLFATKTGPRPNPCCSSHPH